MRIVSAISEDAQSSLQGLPSHAAFARAPRLRAVLQFLIRELIEGRAEEVTELRIAEAVFHRAPDFNASDDNIVRVTVSNLRSRLEEYYKGEGAQDLWVLEIPKGKYTPQVRSRDREFSPLSPPPPVPIPVSPAVDLPLAPVAAPTARFLWMVAVAILVLTNVFTAYRWIEARRHPEAVRGGFLPAMFANRTNPLTVVLPDMNLMNYRLAFGKTVPLSSYLSRSYQDQIPKPVTDLESQLLRMVGRLQLTSTEGTAAAVRLQGAFAPYGIAIRHPSEMSTPDFQNVSVILLGGPYVNPWAQLFENKLNFQTFAAPESVVSEIKNLNPRSGESPVYAVHSDNGVQVTYLRVASLPNLSGNGRVVLIGGNGGATMEAGCEFLTRPESLQAILARLGASDIAHIPSFELLLEIHSFSRTSLNMKIVADRRY